MASIRNARLTLNRDTARRTVRAVVTCDINFSPQDLCQMKICPQTQLFKLRGELMGEDSGLTGADDHLYTYTDVYYFPDTTPASTESRTFEVTVGSGLLDEDLGRDEILGRLRLTNLYTGINVIANTNVVSGTF